ncbi:hypothetical protein IVA96_30390 [Bradyrhizobium sp. 159]|uniref:hypothetical protein n=1 Tax=Bradyrhizobium sp. 159 TaxID=2782632 RepID=UPI001FF9194F|nr:hypothetical protein [Bradyrhizobium sp. 159]MCK1620805.1 hypothetical protein [Bradyrhizobium sp. 159]
MQKFETIIASLTTRGEQLATKRVAAQAALDNATKARQERFLSGDLDDQRMLDKLQDSVNAAASTLSGIDDALAVLARDKAEAERQLADERERTKRVTAADKLAQQVVVIEAALPGYLMQSRVLADALSEIAHRHFESGQIAGCVQHTVGEVEVAANIALPELKAAPDAILHGQRAIPDEPPPVPVTQSPEPPTMAVFMLRSAHYRDHDGRKRFAGQWEDATMPVTTAQLALRMGVAVPVADPRRAQLRGARGGDFEPRAPDVIDLDNHDDGATDAGLDAVRAADFRVVDRGGPRTGTISVTRL